MSRSVNHAGAVFIGMSESRVGWREAAGLPGAAIARSNRHLWCHVDFVCAHEVSLCTNLVNNEIQLMVGHGQPYPFLTPLPSSPFGKMKGITVAGVPQSPAEARTYGCTSNTEGGARVRLTIYPPHLPFWSAKEASLVLMLYNVPS